MPYCSRNPGEEHFHRDGFRSADRGREARQRLGIRGAFLEPHEHALHRVAAERVVGDDRLVGNAERAEQQRREHAGAVFACAAMEHRGQGRGRGEDRDRLRDRARRPLAHLAVVAADVRGVGPFP